MWGKPPRSLPLLRRKNIGTWALLGIPAAGRTTGLLARVLEADVQGRYAEPSRLLNREEVQTKNSRAGCSRSLRDKIDVRHADGMSDPHTSSIRFVWAGCSIQRPNTATARILGVINRYGVHYGTHCEMKEVQGNNLRAGCSRSFWSEIDLRHADGTSDPHTVTYGPDAQFQRPNTATTQIIRLINEDIFAAGDSGVPFTEDLLLWWF